MQQFLRSLHALANPVRLIGLLVCLFILCQTTALAQTISGTVFRDFNSNGSFEAIPASGTYAYGEQGVADVVVTATGSGGPQSATTTADGSYTITGMSGTVRLEFTNLPTGLSDSFRGTQNATSVQFVAAGTTSANFAINASIDYCQSNSKMALTCFVVGSTTNPSENIIVTIPEGTTGTGSSDKTMLSSSPAIVGSVWGMAYDRNRDRLFTAAFMRRHSAFGSGGTGAIYQTNNATNAPASASSVFIDLNGLTVANANGGTVTINTGTDPHDASDYFKDIKTPGKNPFDAVGKIALGDIDISADNKYLYTVSLNDKLLLRIAVDADNDPATNPTAADVTAYPLPNPGCVNGEARPFGLGISNAGLVSVGLICDGSGSGATRSDLKATVYALNPLSGTFSQQTNFSLEYYRGLVSGGEFGTNNDHYWQTWVNDWTATSPPNSDLFVRNTIAYPQPLLSDIVYDVDGSLILGFLDRFGHQSITLGPDANDAATAYDPRAGGDVLRVCNTGTVSAPAYALEVAGKCGPNGGGTFAAATYSPKEQEYYTGDNFNNNSHTETGLGALGLLPGTNQVVMSAFDPINQNRNGQVYTNGFKYLNNATGAEEGGFSVLNSTANPFGKSSGLGDIEMLCAPAPIQIGNRVWNDLNDDGVQDPNEPPLANITVTLKGPGLPAAGVEVITNTAGEYYFSNAAGTDAPGFVYSLSGLVSDGAYTLTFPTSASAGTLVISGKPNSAPGPNADAIDTDPNAAGVLSFTLGQAGQNNFTYDAGYVLPASLGDYVFLDTDRNGTQSAGDAPIPNVLVTLFQNGSAVATTTTDANGLYSFTGLAPGSSNSYVVGFATPSGLSSTSANVGDDALDSDADPLTGRTQTYTLTAGENNTTVDAGYVAPLPLLSKRVSVSRAELGSVVSYTLAMANPAGVASASTTVSDTFGAGIELVAGSLVASVGTGSPTVGGLSWAVPSLPASSTATLTFSASLTQEGIAYNTATTPDGQTATVCTTVPVHICVGTPFEFEFTAPASFSTYQWSLNGQPIVGATSNVYNATQVGEYSLATSTSAGCADGSCCPFVIVEDPLPSLTAVAVSASCVGVTPQPNAAITLVGSNTSAVSYNITPGSSFTAGAPLFTSPQPLSAVIGGVLLGNLPNPAQATDYTIRVYSGKDCFTDYVVTLLPTVCACPPPKCVPYVVRKTKTAR